MTFRLRGKNFFLTYPNLPEDVIDVHGILASLWELQPDYLIVARELHKDGTPHYHALFGSLSMRNINNARYFDIGEHHGNYVGARNAQHVCNYITKDNVYYCRGPVPYTPKTKKPSALHTVIQSSSPTALEDAIARGEIPVRGYKRLREDINAWQLNRDRLVQSLDLLNMRFNSCTIGTTLSFRFLNKFKSPKLYIWGPPNTGKTTLLEQYNHKYVFHAPDNNDWGMFDPSFHKIVIFDEFHGQVPLTVLLKFMQGTPTQLNTKGGSIYCNKNLPMVFLSNVPPESCYRQSDAFLARLRVFHFDTWQHIDNIN